MRGLALADRAELLALARDAIESGEAFPAPLPLLLLDLPLEQKLERDLVAALAARAPAALATAPEETPRPSRDSRRCWT